MDRYNPILVSVIVPVYNAAPYLPRCLDSICNQTHKQLEILLIDDGSTDGSGAICDHYAQQDHRIQVVHQKNAGPSVARNIGLSKATGDYITFVDSDDFIHLEFVAHLLSLCQQYDCPIGQCGFARGRDTGFSNKPAKEKIELHRKETLFAKRKIKITVWGKLYRQDILNGASFAEGKLHEDEGFTYRLLYTATSIVRSSRCLYYYYQNPLSLTGRDSPVSLDFIAFMEERCDFFIKAHDTKELHITQKEWAIQLMFAYAKAQFQGQPTEDILEKFRRKWGEISAFQDIPIQERLTLQLFARWPKPAGRLLFLRRYRS